VSKADILFAEMCRDILETGISSEGESVRAKSYNQEILCNQQVQS